MNLRRITLRLACLILLLLPSSGRSKPAIEANLTTCREATVNALGREQRIFRSVLFGLTKAKDAPAGEVRFDRNGIPWIKQDDDAWRTTAEGRRHESRTDGGMDREAESDPRKGIFETRRILTSDLVPYAVQAYRTFKCRTVQVCKAVERSLAQETTEPQEITVVVPGCTEEKMRTFLGCHFKAGEAGSSDQADSLTHCRQVQFDLVERERDILKLSTEYDAAERSMLQFSGEFDAFLQEFRLPMMNSLRKAIELIGALHRIPCFLGSCDEGPPP